MPAMRRRMASRDYNSVVQVPEVMGEMDSLRIAESISRTCNIERTSVQDYHSAGHKGHSAVLGPLQFPALKADAVQDVRREMLSHADATLDVQLDSVLANHTSHVIIYVSTPAPEGERAHYEMDEPPYHAIMHTDLKRDVGEEGIEAAKPRQAKEANPQDGLPLFEKYQFLSPGLSCSLATKHTCANLYHQASSWALPSAYSSSPSSMLVSPLLQDSKCRTELSARRMVRRHRRSSRATVRVYRDVYYKDMYN